MTDLGRKQNTVQWWMLILNMAKVIITSAYVQLIPVSQRLRFQITVSYIFPTLHDIQVCKREYLSYTLG